MKASIENIQTELQVLSERLQEFKSRELDLKNPTDTIFGEYTLEDIFIALQSLYDNLKYITNAHKIFFNQSTLSERQQIFNQLRQLNQLLQSHNYPQIITKIEQYRPLLRGIGIYTFSKNEKTSELVKSIDELNSKKSELDSNIIEIRNFLNDNEEKLKRMLELDKHAEELLTRVKSSQESLKKIEDIKTESISNLKTVKAIYSSLITDSQEWEDHQQTLNDLLDNADELILKSNEALGVTTTQSISSEFDNAYIDAKNRWKTVPWVVLTFSFSILAVMLGIFLLVPELILFIMAIFYDNIQTEYLPQNEFNSIGRFLLLTILLSMATFSGQQFIRQKNLIEDYRYKKVLTRSLVGFSSQFLNQKGPNNGENAYLLYIQSVLKEILQDPIRSRKSIDRKDYDKLFEKVPDIVSNFTSKQ